MAYDRFEAAMIAHKRFHRAAFEMMDSPHLQDINAAGRRLGMASRADAGEAVRRYIERKKEMIARDVMARQPFRPILCNGRSCNYGRGAR